MAAINQGGTAESSSSLIDQGYTEEDFLFIFKVHESHFSVESTV